MAKALLRAIASLALVTGVVSMGLGCSDDSSSSSSSSGGTPDGGPPAASKDIVDTAIAAGNFKTLAAALTKANLVETLKGKGPFTVFAPTDAAFEKLGDISGLTAEQLTPILTYHVYSGSAKATDVVGLNGQIIKTVNPNADLAITVAGTKVTLNNGKKRSATVTQTDIIASNGVIHVLDTVLDPADKPTDVVQTAIDNGGFTKLAGALTKAELVPTLKGAGPFTVFAPTDAAFDKLGDISGLTKEALTPILTYHVLPNKTIAADVVKANGTRVDTVLSGKKVKITVDGGNVFLDYAVKVSATDIIATNGVVHVIDNVLSTKDIVETAQGNANLSTLVAALTAGDLVTALQADGPFTVFAPTNDAFVGLNGGALGTNGLVDTLLLTGNKTKLQQALKYHVLGAAAPASVVLTLDGKDTPNTLEGKPVRVGITGGNVFLDPTGTHANASNAQVTTTDIFTRNGIVHVINKVLVPSDFVAP